jgi:FMN phosphatase YigB (HAD superfamily)
MTLTLLLDLDDTLLDSNMDVFIPAYFQKLAEFLENWISPEILMKYLFVGTQAMIANERADCTLKEVFDAHFYPNLAVDRDILAPKISQFYDEIFPTLSRLTHPIPAAVRFVEWALKQGYRIGIATNPLFPQKAIYHRLHWAGLPPENYPFMVISSYEEFHFSKPNPAYFAEVLARMGWPEGKVILAGDDLERDIKPAQRLGLQTYRIIGKNSNLLDGDPRSVYGTLEEFQSWLESDYPNALPEESQSYDASIAILQSTPAALYGMLSTEPVVYLNNRPNSKEWRIIDILCHLRDVEREVNLPLFKSVLDHINPHIERMDPEKRGKKHNYDLEDNSKVLQEFVALRSQTLGLLKPIMPDDFIKIGHPSSYNPTNFEEIVKMSTSHDQEHIRKIWKVLHGENG